MKLVLDYGPRVSSDRRLRHSFHLQAPITNANGGCLLHNDSFITRVMIRQGRFISIIGRPTVSKPTVLRHRFETQKLKRIILAGTHHDDSVFFVGKPKSLPEFSNQRFI
jgi:hypothetical protein